MNNPHYCAKTTFHSREVMIHRVLVDKHPVNRVANDCLRLLCCIPWRICYGMRLAIICNCRQTLCSSGLSRASLGTATTI